MNNESALDKTSQHNIDGIWYGQATEFLTSNLSGEYEFVYSGSDNGMGFIFVSPVGYDLVNPIKEVSFFAGADILTDFNSKTPYTSNHLSFDIPFGIKIYPNLAGFCLGLAYANGFRSDYFNLEESGKVNSKTSWGNGFKFLIEYNFAHSGSSPYLPTVGGYWKHMPRGNSTYDNQLCIYVCSNF